MRIPTVLREQLVAHALEQLPYECCGLIAGRPGTEPEWAYAARNAAESVCRFEIDGLDQFRIQAAVDAAGLELVAIYHSHTIGEAYPSENDVAMHARPELLCVIVGVTDPDWPELRAFQIRDGEVAEVTLEA